MTKKSECDFRESFGRMAPQAVINRQELAFLLSTSVGAISQMTYRGELPPNAFPSKRRACWFVADIKHWLSSFAENRKFFPMPEESMPVPISMKPGRPRKNLAKEIR